MIVPTSAFWSHGAAPFATHPAFWSLIANSFGMLFAALALGALFLRPQIAWRLFVLTAPFSAFAAAMTYARLRGTAPAEVLASLQLGAVMAVLRFCVILAVLYGAARFSGVPRRLTGETVNGARD